MELEEKISEELRAIDSQEFIIHEPVVDVPLPSRRSSRVSRSSERYMGMLMEEVKEIFLMGDRGHTDDPNTFDEVMSNIDSKKWLDAMKSEIDSMYSNQVWTLVDLPKDILPIGCK